MASERPFLDEKRRGQRKSGKKRLLPSEPYVKFSIEAGKKRTRLINITLKAGQADSMRMIIIGACNATPSASERSVENGTLKPHDTFELAIGNSIVVRVQRIMITDPLLDHWNSVDVLFGSCRQRLA